MRQGSIGYGHLLAISSTGYEHNASYALDWNILKYYLNTLRFFDQGSGAGLENAENGLVQYKKRWTTLIKPVYFCGRVLNEGVYQELCDQKNAAGSNYFPLYRLGEFNPGG